MKRKIDALEYSGTILKALSGGVLMTTKVGYKVNTMTIGWGHIGIEWGRPIFVAYVRESRYTKEMIDSNGEFTINVPLGAVDKKILGYCGTKSGRETDKIADLALHLEEPDAISVPGIRELPLTLECKVIYVQKEDSAAVPQNIIDRYYPDVSDMHTAYYGEILSAYILE